MSVVVDKSISSVVHGLPLGRPTIFQGDCSKLISRLADDSIDLVITSPPYCIGKAYERELLVADFKASHKRLLPALIKKLKQGGNLCWQVGYHSSDQGLFPLDYEVFSILRRFTEMKLRNRIVWTYGHGLHGNTRFSGRHEVVLWFSKGDNYTFNLDAVRVPQKYPGKRHYKGDKRGELSGNPNGKNPGDVWDIPNVKANHVEKTDHPCQYPVALALRLARALSPVGGMIFDPFLGSGSTGVAAVVAGRQFLGAEVKAEYAMIAERRMNAALAGNEKYRPEERPVYEPSTTSAVAQRPEHFLGEENRNGCDF